MNFAPEDDRGHIPGVGDNVYCFLIYQSQVSDPNRSGIVLNLVTVMVASQLNGKFSWS